MASFSTPVVLLLSMSAQWSGSTGVIFLSKKKGTSPATVSSCLGNAVDFDPLQW